MDHGSPVRSQKVTLWWAMGFVWDVLVAVAVPTTFFALVGRWLDQKWGLSPLLTVLGLVMALCVTYALMRRKAKILSEKFMPRKDL